MLTFDELIQVYGKSKLLTSQYIYTSLKYLIVLQLVQLYETVIVNCQLSLNSWKYSFKYIVAREPSIAVENSYV